MNPPRPPRGYSKQDWPLPHEHVMEFGFSLYGGHSPLLNQTIIPLFNHDDEVIATPSTRETNPRNTNFGEQANLGTLRNSIIPRLRFHMSCNLTKHAIETDKVRNASLMLQPIYGAFRETWDAKDFKTDLDVKETIELTFATATEEVYPIFNGTDLPALTGGIFPPTQLGLTTDLKPEATTIDFNNLAYAQRYYSTKGLLNKVLGNRMWFNISRDKPLIFDWNRFVNPTVKRSNPYMFCGMIMYAPDEYNHRSIITSGELTDPTATASACHMKFMMNWGFHEWNNQFDSTEES